MVRPLADIDQLLLEHRGVARRVAHRLHRRFPRIPWDDLEAACWVGVWEAIRTFDPARGNQGKPAEDRLANWVFAYASYHGSIFARDERRRGVTRFPRREAVVGDLTDLDALSLPAPGGSPGGESVDWPGLLGGLSPHQRRAVGMRYRDGCGFAEIAWAMRLAGENAARAIVSRALRRLAGDEDLRREYEDP